MSECWNVEILECIVPPELVPQYSEPDILMQMKGTGSETEETSTDTHTLHTHYEDDDLKALGARGEALRVGPTRPLRRVTPRDGGGRAG
ncbi:hypothetical protein P4O66_017395 [Electrophorus voltai]|uniref:Uncharacterized protein n=1 Tax=Electrophorus voltai TaxID=2609070 RepID=A0AAD9DLJ3_9TELE|nr:hypothetical protein P4O66_017395 [Electrophorus voltai]